MLESIARLILELILPSSQLLILLAAIVVLILIGWHPRVWRAGIVWVMLLLVYATPFLSNALIDWQQFTWPVLTEERLVELGLLELWSDNPGLDHTMTEAYGLLQQGTFEPC